MIYRSNCFYKYAVLRICYHIHNKTTRGSTDEKFRCQCQVNKWFPSTAQSAVELGFAVFFGELIVTDNCFPVFPAVSLSSFQIQASLVRQVQFLQIIKLQTCRTAT